MLKGTLRFLIVLLMLNTADAASDTLLVKVEGAHDESLPSVANILETRFDHLRTGLFFSVKAETQGRDILLTFKGWQPTGNQSQYLVSTAGVLSVNLLGTPSTLLFTDKNVADARASERNNKPVLAIALDDASTSFVAEKTADARGRFVGVKWDRKILARLRIDSALSRFLLLSMKSQEEAELMSAVLRSGRLPEGVKLSLVKP